MRAPLVVQGDAGAPAAHPSKNAGATSPPAAPLPQAGVSLLLSLPWSAWSTFVLEARHGFNKTSAATFVADKLKAVRAAYQEDLGEGLRRPFGCWR